MAKGITILEGADLRTFFTTTLGVEVPADVYSVRVWQQADGTVKIKANQAAWTWALGQADE